MYTSRFVLCACVLVIFYFFIVFRMDKFTDQVFERAIGEACGILQPAILKYVNAKASTRD